MWKHVLLTCIFQGCKYWEIQIAMIIGSWKYSSGTQERNLELRKKMGLQTEFQESSASGQRQKISTNIEGKPRGWKRQR